VFDSILERTGRWATHHRWAVVIFWLVLAASVTLLAPNIDSVVTSDTRDLLPTNAPYQQAEDVLKSRFPAQYSDGTTVIATETTDLNIRDAAPWNYLDKLTKWLHSADAPRNITTVLSPVSSMPLMSDAMIAKDGHLALILVDFNTDTTDPATVDALRSIDNYLTQNAVEGVKSYVTGTPPIIDSYTGAAFSSVGSTLGITIVFVVLLLLLVYRSPISPLIPLIAVAVSYLITRGLVGFLGKYVMTVSSFTNELLIVILFGAGTDYCLFLISRFREELADDGNVSAAAQRTVRRVGETIASSAGTVIVGFVMMSFAEMGIFRTIGPALALAIVVMVLVGLTLTPALLALMGKWAFWPGHASRRDIDRLAGKHSERIVRHPVLVIVLIVLALGPLSLLATTQRVTYNMLDDLPKNYGARVGFEAIAAHMDSGQLQPLNVVIEGLNPQTALRDVASWTGKLRAMDGVADVRSLSDPLGKENSTLQGITSISRQLSLAADALGAIKDQMKAGDLSGEDLSMAMNALPFVYSYLDAIEKNYPQVAGDKDLAAIRATLKGFAGAFLTGTLDQSLQALQNHLAALSKTFEGIDGAYYLPDALPKTLVEALGGQDPLVMLSSRYVTADRTAARFEVILGISPFSDQALDTIVKMRAALPGGSKAISGFPASMADLRDAMQRDMARAFFFVLLGILVVLLVLLRSIIPPIYLMLSILLSYAATIGIVQVVSQVLLGTQALTWWVPFFMFVLLVALGMDYNIFLMGRVTEEARRYGMADGVRRATTATGAIIASAGIIMAGTFSAMMSSVIVGLAQLGFAVAVGVLLDTFVIQGMLIPAVAVLLDRWNWWPGRDPHIKVSDGVQSAERGASPSIRELTPDSSK
jgi:RND superfamily putative drug exporter